LVTISTAASGATSSRSDRRPRQITTPPPARSSRSGRPFEARLGVTPRGRPHDRDLRVDRHDVHRAPGRAGEHPSAGRFRVQSRGSKPTRTVIPQSVRDIEVFWPERAGFRAPVQPSRSSSGHIPAALAQADPRSSPSPAALVRRAGCGTARSGQPSFTAVPEALTISMLFPTVS
jgi:hypothetical protein